MKQSFQMKTHLFPCRNETDWICVREIFIQAFRSYPPYIYMVPDESKRDEFLRRYLEAIYDTCVRNGECLLVCLKLFDVPEEMDPHKEDENDLGKIVGGVLLAPPAETGGWQCADNESFVKAYEKYKLQKYYPEAYKRMERYEDWEFNNISKYICESGVPMWNGLFCAMDPKYVGLGYGSLNYENCMQILQNYNKAKDQKIETIKDSEFVRAKKSCDNKISSKESLMIKLMHAAAMLHRRPKVLAYPVSSEKTLKSQNKAKTQANSDILILALSHSKRSVSFYENNGFHTAAELPYRHGESAQNSDVGSCLEFKVNVLLLNVCPEKTAKPVLDTSVSPLQIHNTVNLVS